MAVIEKHLEPEEEISPDKILLARNRLEEYGGEVELTGSQLNYQGYTVEIEIKPEGAIISKSNRFCGDDWEVISYLEENLQLKEP